MSAVGFAATAFLISLLSTFVLERGARQAGLVARPVPDRWHRAPVPLLGGLAIVVATVGLTLVATRGDRDFTVLALTAAAMAVVGLVDDVRQLTPRTKLLAQLVLAGVFLYFGLSLRLTGYALIDVFLTLFWLVGITNAFNLLDNMDGLAGSVAVIGAAFRLLFFHWEGDAAGFLATAIFIGAIGGFLLRNLPPAKIFMGDTGSLFLGFFLAGLSLTAVRAPYSRGVAAVLVTPVLLLLIPIFDTTFVSLTRLLTARAVLEGGRDHTSHRLVSLGITERQALLLLCGASVASGLLAILSYRYGFTYTVVLLALLLIGMVLLGVHLSAVRVVGEAPASPDAVVVRLVADLPFKRHIATLALDVVLIVVAYYAAYLLRFEAGFDAHREAFLRTVGPLIILQVSALELFGAYRGLWRYTSLPDLLGLLRGVTVGAASTVLYFVFTTRFEGLSRAVFVIDWLLLIALLGGSRVAFRLLGERLRPAPDDFQRVLIYGADAAGELMLRELRNNPGLRRRPVGFLDDDRSKIGTRIHELPILGDVDRVGTLLTSHRVREVIVPSARISAEQIRRLELICAPRGVAIVLATLRLEETGNFLDRPRRSPQ